MVVKKLLSDFICYIWDFDAESWYIVTVTGLQIYLCFDSFQYQNLSRLNSNLIK